MKKKEHASVKNWPGTTCLKKKTPRGEGARDDTEKLDGTYIKPGNGLLYREPISNGLNLTEVQTPLRM